MAAKNQYFLKDKKAQIYRKTESGYDKDGFPVSEKYYPIAPAQIWCYSRQLSQEAVYYSQMAGTNETRMFVFNHYKCISVYDLILYRGKWYTVSRVDTKDDQNGDVFVYAEDTKVRSIPKDSEIQPYMPDVWKNE